MGKLIKVIVKIMIFFLVWAILGGLIDIPSEHPAMWRFWAECIPLMLMVLDSIAFWLFEKRQVMIIGFKNIFCNLAAGSIAGLLWVSIPTAVLYLLGVITFTGPENIEYLWLWIISMFLNSIMQELLVRGYMYELIKREYRIASAMIFTTGLFTIFHGGAFEAGVIAVINVVTMSLAMSFVLEYTGTLIAPIMMHAVYNIIDGIILGTGTVVEYPHVFSAVYNGPKILTGGSFEMSGSIVVFVVNIILLAITVLLYIKRKIV